MPDRILLAACLAGILSAMPAQAQSTGCFSSTPDACQFGFYDMGYVVNYFAFQNGLVPEFDEIGEPPRYSICVNTCAATFEASFVACLGIPDGEQTGPQARHACIAAAESALNSCMAGCNE